MVRRTDDGWVLSVRDVLSVVECDHRFSFDHAAASGLVRPEAAEATATSELVSQRAKEHEADVVAALRGRMGVDLVEISDNGPDWAQVTAAAAATQAALDAGAPAVYGGVVLAGGLVAYPDVLTRVHPGTGTDLTSPDGRHRYEPLQIRLAHSLKDSTLLQLGVAAEALTRWGYPEPDEVHAWLGTGEIASQEAGPAVDQVRDALTDATRRLDRTAAVPEPAWADKRRACKKCRWSPTCATGRAAARDLSLVWGIRYRHIQPLRAAGLTTIDALADAMDDLRPEEMGEPDFAELRSQAAVQLAGERAGRLEFTVHSDAGLVTLPPPHPGDLYYDIEGDPFHDADGSLEYLHGFVDADERYTGFWAHSRDGERRALEKTLDLIRERRQRFPHAHIYHYAAYEPFRLTELSKRHAHA